MKRHTGVFLAACLVLIVLLWSFGPNTVSGQATEKSKKKEPFQVLSVNTAVSPSQYAGRCPKTFMFAARIEANGKGIVKYLWIRKDGVRGPIETVRFEEPGYQIVTTSWTLAGEGKLFDRYWKAVQILSPNPFISNPATFTLKCMDTDAVPPDNDIDVSLIYLDEHCRLWVRHTNRGIRTLKAVLREQVWVDDRLIWDNNETFILKPGQWTSHPVGDPGYPITRFAKVKVFVDANNHLAEYNESNNTKTITLTCIR